MRPPSVVVLDVNETLSDLRPMGQRFAEVGADPSLARLWFASVLRDGFALTAARSTATFRDLGADLLRELLPREVPAVPGEGPELERAVEHVLSGFMGLPLHPDVAPGVRALADQGLRLVTLSNGPAEVAERLLGDAGLRDLFSDVLSVEDAGVWKPGPGAYEYAAEVCGTPLRDMLMVAVHPWDVDGAARAGMQTAWVDRDGRPYPSYATPPVLTVASLVELAGTLGA